MSAGPMRRTLQIVMDTVAAGTSAKRRWRNTSGRAWIINTAQILTDITATGHADNHTVIALQRGANEGGLTTIGSHNTDSDADGTLTAGTPVTISLTGGTAKVIASGDLLALSKADAGAGVAWTGSIILDITEWVG